MMICCSAVAIPTSVCTMSIGASEPTSILMRVMRFRSAASVRASLWTSRFRRA
jgi:hypothetical protein